MVSGKETPVAVEPRRRLRVLFSFRPEQYLLALGQAAVLGYWSMYSEALRNAALLIAAQVALAYAIDVLLVQRRGDRYELGLGPCSAVLTLNLFLRFHNEWFVLQFCLVAVAVVANRALCWQRAGRRTPIFNAPALALAVFALGLSVTRSTELTWIADMSSTLLFPPQIYLFVLVASVPALFVLRTTAITLSAGVTVWALSALALRVSGTYFFVDSTIPIAVFLGIHLLVADPVTSPRRELAQILFGVFYGTSVFALYGLLLRFGAPAYFALLLPLPVLNVIAPMLDRFADAPRLAWVRPEGIGRALASSRRSLAYVMVWGGVFGGMSVASAVGDHHPGRTIQFWDQACRADRPGACGNLSSLLQRYCTLESGWACNELGILRSTGKLKAVPNLSEMFTRACGFGQKAGCENVRKLEANQRDFVRGEPTVLDFPRILQAGKGPIAERTSLQLFTRACDDGWMSGCDGLTAIYFRGIPGVSPDKARAAALALKGCEANYARSCSNLGLMHKNGDGVAQDAAKALLYLKRSCDLGFQDGCRWLAEEQAK